MEETMTEQRCSTCRYIDLEYDVLPCSDCFHCSISNNNKPSHWAPQVDGDADTSTKLDAILENQNHIRLELCRIYRAIDKLITLIEEEGKSNEC